MVLFPEKAAGFRSIFLFPPCKAGMAACSWLFCGLFGGRLGGPCGSSGRSCAGRGRRSALGRAAAARPCLGREPQLATAAGTAAPAPLGRGTPPKTAPGPRDAALEMSAALGLCARVRSQRWKRHPALHPELGEGGNGALCSALLCSALVGP